MPTVKVRNLKNKEVGDVELLDAVFGVELNEALIHSAVMNYQANGRQGTSATKTRGNVSGSGRKLWKQKGTGRARIASIRSPLWKGGGNVHGPQPRDWSYQMPKKMRRGALRSALSGRLREGNLIIIDEFGFENSKTSGFLGVLGTLGLFEKNQATKTLIIDSLDNENLILSSRNVRKTKVTNSFGLNIYDIIYHEKLLISRSALDELSALLDPKRESGKIGEEVKEVAVTPVEAKPKTAKVKAPKAAKQTAEEPRNAINAKDVAPKVRKSAKKASADESGDSSPVEMDAEPASVDASTDVPAETVLETPKASEAKKEAADNE
ncbi:MAG: 50S ribosomal protein L4 [Pyrinomonadaceae bacterium]